MIGDAGRADTGAFLTRLLRLDPAAVVRLRPPRLYPGRPGQAELWAMLPFGVLVVRLVTTPLTSDATVAAAELLRSLERGGAWPARRDESWRWPVPSTRGEVVEVIPATDVERVARAASVTLREASTQGLGGRRVGERVLRDALLDHVPIVVTTASGQRLDVPQRLVQAVVRMGFLRPAAATLTGADTEGDNSVTVRSAGRWISLECSYGSAWYLATSPLRLS